MYAMKRIIAYVIDIIVMTIPSYFCVSWVETKIFESLPERVEQYAGLLIWGVSLLTPVLVLGVLSGLTGRTPGKLLMFLKVVDHGGDPPGIVQGILREIAKAVSLGFFFGMFYALQGLLTSKQTFYDTWLDLEVEDLRPVGLTPTQKNFRKYMREKAKRERG